MKPKTRALTPTSYLSEDTIASSVLPMLFSKTAPITIFDVGACDALDSIRYARLFPYARVFAFEPRPDNIALAHDFCNKFNCSHITIVPYALSDRCGFSVLHLSEGRPCNALAERSPEWDFGNKSSSLLAPDMAQIHEHWPWLQFNRTLNVPTITVDEYCDSQSISCIDFMHLDVQGAELLILNGAKKYLHTIKALWLEVSNTQFYHSQPVAAELESFLRQNQFHKHIVSAAGAQSDELYVRRE